MSFQTGDNIGPYQITKQLGRGGMATVYQAYHPALDRYVAIKGMHVAFSEDPNFLARFQREARVVAKLEHPNIVPIYDFAEHGGQPYLVMKYIEGDTLKARLGKGPLTQPELIRIVESIGGALDYAHRQGILHRDIKPSNVLLSPDGGIYLTDFGLARIAQAGESTLSADMMLGTPQYISPEQAIGATHLDEGTDIYSFGIMLYELVVGQVPFSADTPYSIVHDHIYTPLPLPRLRKADVPEPVERVLLKALAKKRADRYETVAQLVDAFKKGIAGLELPLTPPPAPAPKIDPLELMDTLPIAEADSLPGAGATPPGARVPAGVTPAPAAPKNRRWRWWYLIPLGFVLCICLSIFRGCVEAANQPPPPQSFPDFTPPAPSVPVEEALQAVEADPEDAMAYLDLAVAYWDTGEAELAYISFEIARDLGGRDPLFLRRAADLLAERELWLETVEMIIPLALQADGVIPPEFAQRFERALYNAASDPRLDSSEVVTEGNFRQLKDVDPLLVQVATLRAELDDEEFEYLFAQVEILVTQNPDFGPARLLKAEIYIQFGEPEIGRSLLEQLLRDEPALSWITIEARRMLFALNQEN